MFYLTDYFLSLYREENTCKMVSLQWKDRATLRELAPHLLSETTTDEVMVSLYFRAIKFLLSKLNRSMYALNSTPILSYRTFLLISSFGTFLFLQHLQSIPPCLHTPLSLPTQLRVLATQSINSHLKDQRPPNSSLKCACLLLLSLHSPSLSFLTPSNFLKEWHGRVVQGKAKPEAVVRREVMNML